MRTTPLERNTKAQILQYLRLLERTGRLVVFEIYNGPRIQSIGKRKVFIKNPTPGISDLVILPNGKPEIWAELKREKGGKQSPDQVLFEQKCKQMGHFYCIWRGIDDVLATFKELGIQN